MSTPHRIFALAFSLLTVLQQPPAAHAGCGCDKPPPPPADVRPAAAYTGVPISIFAPGFQVGQTYSAMFASGISGQSAVVDVQVASLRDVADGVYKPQLVVPLPALSPGPASIVVTDPATGGEVAFVPDTEFIVVPAPVIIPAQAGTYSFKGYQAAVDHNGVSYVALDLTNLTQPLVVDAQTTGYPLRFTAPGVTFYNAQGFMMQKLTKATQPIPGMYVMPAVSTDLSVKSDILHYSRHEFETYFLQHQERLPHAVDPTDGNWHLDGTRHVDHNHLILAIGGKLNTGAVPAAGATAPFTLTLKAYSLFYQGLVGASSVTMSGGALINSYSSKTLVYGSNGDVFTNGTLSMATGTRINGSATAKAFKMTTGAAISGTKTLLSTPQTFMTVLTPPGLPSLGKISLTSGTYTITGPGSFLVTSIAMTNTATLYVDNSAGPVTLYVSGSVAMSSTAHVATADPNPEKFALYATSNGSIGLSGNPTYHGVVYAPKSSVSITGSGDFFGSFVGSSVALSGTAKAHYEETLRGQ